MDPTRCSIQRKLKKSKSFIYSDGRNQGNCLGKRKRTFRIAPLGYSHLFYVFVLSACMCEQAPHTCLVPKETRWHHQIPGTGGTEGNVSMLPGQPVVLTTEPSLLASWTSLILSEVTIKYDPRYRVFWF